MDFKSGFIAVVGRPNAGKSTIINAVAGEKISIISKKPQTTRNKILAIVTEEDYQVVFVDTPGVHREKTKLGTYMNSVALGSISEVDAAVLVVDAAKGFGIPEEKIAEELKKEKIPTILAINKVDAVKKEEILPLMAKAGEIMSFEQIVPLSALHKDGIDILFEEIKKFLPKGPMYYPDDMITDRTEREIAAETIREKLLRLLEQEIPHGTAIEVFEMRDEENVLKISANIYCEKKAHKAIIIGKGGSMLKKVGSYARADMEQFFGKKVYLTMWVKVKDGWRDNNFMLKSLGFTKEE